MTKHLSPGQFKSHAPEGFKIPPAPTAAELQRFFHWTCDDPPRGYIVPADILFRAVAVIEGVHILLGAYASRAEACRVIVEAHGGRADA